MREEINTLICLSLSIVLTGDKKLEGQPLAGRAAFVWPCLAFLKTVLKSLGSQLSADPKKLKINWNLPELQAET